MRKALMSRVRSVTLLKIKTEEEIKENTKEKAKEKYKSTNEKTALKIADFIRKIQSYLAVYLLKNLEKTVYYMLEDCSKIFAFFVKKTCKFSEKY